MLVFAFLRAINVGGRRPKGPELVAAVAGDGVADAVTFLASGNLVFTTDRDDLADLATTIGERLESALGYEVTTFLRTAPDLAAIVDDLPTLATDENGPIEKHQIIFFADDPGDATRRAFADTAGPTDRLSWRTREVIWTHRGGMMDSALGTARPDAWLPANTVRTANTVERLLAKFA